MQEKHLSGVFKVSTSILLVEDDALFGETIVEFLQECDFDVEHHLDASSALQATYFKNFDLYLFDINLPTLSGIELLKELKRSSNTTPTIYLTSSELAIDIKNAFEAGADDFIKKTVPLDELALRIKALLRRTYGEPKIYFDDFVLDQDTMTLTHNQRVQTLKPKVFTLLQLLLSKKNQIVTHEEIQERLYSPDKKVSFGSIRVCFNEIKNSIGEGYIRNIRGVGYQFESK